MTGRKGIHEVAVVVKQGTDPRPMRDSATCANELDNDCVKFDVS